MPRSWVWFPADAWTDQMYNFNAMQGSLDKIICQMHEFNG